MATYEATAKSTDVAKVKAMATVTNVAMATYMATSKATVQAT